MLRGIVVAAAAAFALASSAAGAGESAYHLKVPVGTSTKVVELLDRVPTYKFPPLPANVQHVKADNGRWYRVRGGDTLEKVSKRCRVPMKTLKAKNNLTSPVTQSRGALDHRTVIP